MKKFILTVVFVMASVLTASAHDYPNPVTAVDAKAWIDTGTAVLIDVRELSEVTAGMAEPAEWYAKSVIDTDLDAFITHLGQYSGKEIVLYCRSGRRVSVIVEALAKKNVMAWNMGGYSDWVDAGFPTKLYSVPR